MSSPVTEICPTCKQKVMKPEATRFCFNCKKPMGSHDKYYLKTDEDFKTYIVHKHCDNPQGYYPKGTK